MLRLDRIAALTDPRSLSGLFGPVRDVRVEPVSLEMGSTRATHRRVRVHLGDGRTRHLWLKENLPDTDWTAHGTGDAVGREAALLAEPALARIWDSLGCPYHAFAVEDGAYALLMDDLSEHLMTRRLGIVLVRSNPVPVTQLGRAFTVEEEDAILGAMAGMHARYWDSAVTRLSWLQSPWRRMHFMGLHDTPKGTSSPRTRRDAWDRALAPLPALVADLLLSPTDALAARCEGLPWTVFHGDLRWANLALPPGGGVVAFDWGMMGAGPATLDLYWYLFTSWPWRARPHEAVVARYRRLLEAALGRGLPDRVWARLVEVGLLCGAIMQMGKLVNWIAIGASGAAAEWDWRVQQLERLT